MFEWGMLVQVNVSGLYKEHGGSLFVSSLITAPYAELKRACRGAAVPELFAPVNPFAGTMLSDCATCIPM